FVDELDEIAAGDKLATRPLVDGLRAEVREADVVLHEVPQLLHPLVLDVLPRGDDQDAKVGLVVPEEREDPKGYVRLAHADLVGEVCDTMLRQDVVNGHGPFELLAGALPLADARTEVDEGCRSLKVNHASRSWSGTARR